MEMRQPGGSLMWNIWLLILEELVRARYLWPNLSVCLSICLSTYLPTYLPIYLIYILYQSIIYLQITGLNIDTDTGSSFFRDGEYLLKKIPLHAGIEVIQSVRVHCLPDWAQTWSMNSGEDMCIRKSQGHLAFDWWVNGEIPLSVWYPSNILSQALPFRCGMSSKEGFEPH